MLCAVSVSAAALLRLGVVSSLTVSLIVDWVEPIKRPSQSKASTDQYQFPGASCTVSGSIASIVPLSDAEIKSM